MASNTASNFAAPDLKLSALNPTLGTLALCTLHSGGRL